MAFVCAEFSQSERTACKLLGVDRSSYRYEPRPDRNTRLREELIKLARQKPRFGYRRLHAILERRGEAVNVKRSSDARTPSWPGAQLHKQVGYICADQSTDSKDPACNRTADHTIRTAPTAAIPSRC